MTFPGTLTVIYPSSSPSVLTPSQLTPPFPIPFKLLFYPALFFSPPWSLLTFLISVLIPRFTFTPEDVDTGVTDEREYIVLQLLLVCVCVCVSTNFIKSFLL